MYNEAWPELVNQTQSGSLRGLNASQGAREVGGGKSTSPREKERQVQKSGD